MKFRELVRFDLGWKIRRVTIASVVAGVGKPRAGIDPDSLLIDGQWDDDVQEVKSGRVRHRGPGLGER